jgi:hypothetical protein
MGGVSRFKLVVPENVARLPSSMSLSSCVLYSPRCLAKLRRAVAGKRAYIVPNVVGEEDKLLSMALRCPLYAGDPTACRPFLTKSGAHRVFLAADVSTAPGMPTRVWLRFSAVCRGVLPVVVIMRASCHA